MALLHGDYRPLAGYDPGERARRRIAEEVARRAGLFPGDAALVAPAGVGLVAAPLARAFTRCRVVAVDDDAEALARTVANAEALDAAARLRPYRADPADLPFEDECFPLAACALALHAREDAMEVLEELHRVAHYHAKLLVVEPDFSRLARKPRGWHRNVFDEDGLEAVKDLGWGKVALQKLDVLPDGVVLQMLSAKRFDAEDEEGEEEEG